MECDQRYVGNGRYAANMLGENGLSMKMLEKDKLTGGRARGMLNECVASISPMLII